MDSSEPSQSRSRRHRQSSRDQSRKLEELNGSGVQTRLPSFKHSSSSPRDKTTPNIGIFTASQTERKGFGQFSALGSPDSPSGIGKVKVTEIPIDRRPSGRSRHQGISSDHHSTHVKEAGGSRSGANPAKAMKGIEELYGPDFASLMMEKDRFGRAEAVPTPRLHRNLSHSPDVKKTPTAFPSFDLPSGGFAADFVANQSGPSAPVLAKKNVPSVPGPMSGSFVFGSSMTGQDGSTEFTQVPSPFQTSRAAHAAPKSAADDSAKTQNGYDTIRRADSKSLHRRTASVPRVSSRVTPLADGNVPVSREHSSDGLSSLRKMYGNSNDGDSPLSGEPPKLHSSTLLYNFGGAVKVTKNDRYAEDSEDSMDNDTVKNVRRAENNVSEAMSKLSVEGKGSMNGRSRSTARKQVEEASTLLSQLNLKTAEQAISDNDVRFSHVTRGVGNLNLRDRNGIPAGDPMPPPTGKVTQHVLSPRTQNKKVDGIGKSASGEEDSLRGSFVFTSAAPLRAKMHPSPASKPKAAKPKPTRAPRVKADSSRASPAQVEAERTAANENSFQFPAPFPTAASLGHRTSATPASIPSPSAAPASMPSPAPMPAFMPSPAPMPASMPSPTHVPAPAPVAGESTPRVPVYSAESINRLFTPSSRHSSQPFGVFQADLAVYPGLRFEAGTGMGYRATPEGTNPKSVPLGGRLQDLLSSFTPSMNPFSTGNSSPLAAMAATSIDRVQFTSPAASTPTIRASREGYSHNPPTPEPIESVSPCIKVEPHFDAGSPMDVSPAVTHNEFADASDEAGPSSVDQLAANMEEIKISGVNPGNPLDEKEQQAERGGSHLQDNLSPLSASSFVSAKETISTPESSSAHATSAAAGAGARSPPAVHSSLKPPSSSPPSSPVYKFISGWADGQPSDSRMAFKGTASPAGRRPHRLRSSMSTSKSKVPSPAKQSVAASLHRAGNAGGGMAASLIEGASSHGEGEAAAKPPDSGGHSSLEAEQVCEKWRVKGNNAYSRSEYVKAEDYYSRGILSVSRHMHIPRCARAAMLCWSNRAATRMHFGHMREALLDCQMAMDVDPTFTKARLRAASCHISLGTTNEASRLLGDCLRQLNDGTTPNDPKHVAEAQEGLKKVRLLEESIPKIDSLLKGSGSNSESALKLVNDALVVSSHSELLLEKKSMALMQLRRFDDVVQLCDSTVAIAERNEGGEESSDDAGKKVPVCRLWRLRICSRVRFAQGKLEESIDLLSRLEKGLISRQGSVPAASADPDSESAAVKAQVSAIKEQLALKAKGNEAFQAGRHSEAVEHYSAALSITQIAECRSFNAVCFCNRAAASQALGLLTDAIADCSRAVALDPSYAKAISRRAALFESVGDYSQAVTDLTRLLDLLKSGKGGSAGQSDIYKASDRLRKAEDEGRKGSKLDHYALLGVEPTCTAADVKKAFRKAALRHHPDKAIQFLPRIDGDSVGNDWKELGDVIRMEADRLFKLIAESYALLSDSAKRQQYDAEDQLRKLSRSGSATARSKASAFNNGNGNIFGDGFGRAGRRARDTWDPEWAGGASNPARWQNPSDQSEREARGFAAGRPFTSRHGHSASRGGYNWDDL